MAPSVLPTGIPNGGSAYAMGAAPVNPTGPISSGGAECELGPIVRATLLRVIFANSQFVGADERGSFERFDKQLKAITEVTAAAQLAEIYSSLPTPWK